MKRVILLILFFSFCQQGVSEADLQILTQEAVKVALEEIKQEPTENIQNLITSEITISQDENNSTKTIESTTTTVARTTTTSTTTTVARTTTTSTTTTVARTTTTSTTTTTIPWATYAGYRYDCVEFLNGRGECTPTTGGGFNKIYCESIKERSNCSEYFYPYVLNEYEIYQEYSRTIICEDAGYGSYSRSDRDCGRYSKGQDPRYVGKYDKCTVSYGSLTCNNNYYPSEENDYQLAQINGGETFVCERGGSVRCYRYNGGSLYQSARGQVAYYCKLGVMGTCSKDNW